MMYFLHQTEKRKWIRHLMAASIVICAFAILGTQSRGALLSLTAMAFFLGLLSKKKLRTSLLMVFLVAVAIGFMPESWLNRMDTIGSYQQDDSAMSRIWTWKTMLAVAMDRPLVGAGFAADNLAVFGKYAPTEPPYDIFTGRVYVAHSIYFQMLGEHGFVGLGLFLLLGIVTWRTSSAVSREAQASEEYASWMPLLMRMVQVSIIGFAIGGAFLSLAYFDVPYYVMGYVVLCKALLLSRSTNRAAASPAATPGPQQGLARPPGGPS
jgi:putative inorganic carbon (HCO3(-)) transporter